MTRSKLKSAIFFALIVFLNSFTKTFAQQVIFEENFSSGFEKWQPNRNNGDTWKIVEGQAEAYVTTGSTVVEMVPKNEYWDNAWKNIEYSLSFTPIQGADRNISFGVIDTSNWYELHFTPGSYEIVRLENNLGKRITSGAFNLADGKTYQIALRIKNGNIELFIDNQLIKSVYDPTFNQGSYGKIGIKAGTGAVTPTKVRFDNIVVRNIDVSVPDGKQLNYEHFKQTDARWGQEEYDSATLWSTNPTIRRWGCVITSLAMIMDYHGLTTMPNGAPVTPSTINTWLKSQADGYLGEGLTNWIAATRLTRLISERYGTHKLEYRRQADTTITTAVNEINENKPSILEIAGHFLTANGVTGNNQDLYIKDPAYNFTLFSEHQQPLLSTRTFQPSHTDLSYLLVAHTPELHLTVTDENGQSIANWESFIEQVRDHVDQSGEHTKATKIQQLAKPYSGTYRISVSQDTFGPFAFQFFAYDKQANVTNLSQSGYVGTEPLVYLVEYHNDGTSTLTRQMSFTQFRQDLRLMKELTQFKQIASHNVLDKVAAWGEAEGSLERQKHYAQLLTVLVKAQRNLMTSDGYAYLTQQTKALHDTF